MSSAVKDETAKALKPYLFLGIDLQIDSNGTEALAECPICGKENKFSVNVGTGLWRCFVCGEKGNPIEFLRKFYKLSDETTPLSEYESLRRDRGLLDVDTLIAWGAVKSPLTGRWMLPGYNASGSIMTLYHYGSDGKRMLLFPTPTMGHWLMGPVEFGIDRPIVYLTEGPWDGMALWETLRYSKSTEDGQLVVTVSQDDNLLAHAAVYSVAGCGAVGKPLEKVAGLFSNRQLSILFDNDYPKFNPKTKRVEMLGAWPATRRAVEIATGQKTPPESVQVLKWGDEGYANGLPDGYDLRDALNQGITPTMSPETARNARLTAFQALADKFIVPDDAWILTRTDAGDDEGLASVECNSYQELRMAWEKAMRWTSGLESGLLAMLASIVSTNSIGDQLWFKILGPASCGKSTLCEAVSVSRKYVVAKSTVRGFHSGYKSDATGEEDNSLVVLCRGKTLVTKDGDTLLQAPNLKQILSEARDIYDRTSRTHYRNKMSKNYTGLSMTWLLCGTSSLKTIDESELGERFLDCVIMDNIDDELEDEILWRVVNKAERNVGYELNGSPETQQDPDMTNAMQLTGGYVEYLRENAASLLPGVYCSDAVKRKCTRFGKFVAYMRARPSSRQDEAAEREFAARLVSQLMRLAKCMAAVLNKSEVDTEVMRQVRKVTFDTSRGPVLEIAKYLYENAEDGVSMNAIVTVLGSTDHRVGNLIRFLRRIGAVESFTRKSQLKNGKHQSSVRYRLTEKMAILYEEVME